MIVMPIDAGEHLLDTIMSYAGGWHDIAFNTFVWITIYYLLRVWEWHKMNM